MLIVRARLIVLLSIASVALLLPEAYAGRKTGVKRIERSKEYLDDVQEAPDKAIPVGLLSECKGVIIVKQYKAGFGIGVKGGTGLAMLRDEQGSWSPPVFISTGEGSIGWQIGGAAIDSVFLIMNDEGVDMLLKTKFKIGVDASAAAGPVGRDAEAKVGVGTAILVYSRAQGLYAGASFEGGLLLIDGDLNEDFYDVDDLSAKEILLEKKVEMPEEAKPLVNALNRYAGIPDATESAASATPAAKEKPIPVTDKTKAKPATETSKDDKTRRAAIGRRRLEELKKLHEDELIDEKEYERMKAEVLETYFK